MVQPPWVPFPSNLSYRRYEAEAIARGFRPNASGLSDIDRLLRLHHPSCRLIVHRSCPEAEPRLFPLLADLFAKPVVPAGLLLPGDVVDDAAPRAQDGDGESLAPLMQWLDEQPQRSVVYVALVRMATGRFRVGYLRVSGLAGLGSGMISHPRFLSSGPRNQSGSVSGLIFHPWISNGYPK